MNDQTSPRLGVVRTAGDLLDEAVRRVGSRVEEIREAAGIRQQNALIYLETLADELRLTMARLPDGPPSSVVSDPLFVPLTEAIGREAIHLAASVDSASAAIEVLRAIEALKAVPGESGSSALQSAADDLRARLHAPDAFELLVEVAHDFRSPLTSILFLAETLRDGHSGDVSQAQRSQLGLMYSAAFGLASVASDIMDLARRERDLIGDDPQPYSLREVFQSVERLVQPIVEEKGLVLDIVVPELAQAVGHPQALSRVLLNLTTNALKFTDEGTVEVGVRASARGRLEYYCQDTGRGIPPERHAELFQPFKRRTGHRNEGHFFSGSGVGLSIARRLVEGMGSELKFETSDESGTRFWFEVPASAPRPIG